MTPYKWKKVKLLLPVSHEGKGCTTTLPPPSEQPPTPPKKHMHAPRGDGSRAASPAAHPPLASPLPRPFQLSTPTTSPNFPIQPPLVQHRPVPQAALTTATRSNPKATGHQAKHPPPSASVSKRISRSLVLSFTLLQSAHAAFCSRLQLAAHQHCRRNIPLPDASLFSANRCRPSLALTRPLLSPPCSLFPFVCLI